MEEEQASWDDEVEFDVVAFPSPIGELQPHIVIRGSHD